MFSTQSENCIPICQYFRHHILFAAALEEPKIGVLSKGLKKVALIGTLVFHKLSLFPFNIEFS